ncbi:unnamed protein product [Arabis nemorensis]|uniref:Uncharacterized protein n=1 Tax=Arabis nemorensis TaxID=586526 RepID=A0A565BIH4_9BRAS|nr:unnamed protein product [Arabis nemorensis]
MTGEPDCNGVDQVMSGGSEMKIRHEMVNHVAFITDTEERETQDMLDYDEIAEPKSTEDCQGLYNL